MINEKIKELALKAYNKVGVRTPEVLSLFMETYCEKFAELVVRECVDKIETYRIPVGNSSAGEMACEWTYDALKEIRDDINEQFGMKP